MLPAQVSLKRDHYYRRMRAIRPASLLGYWPLSETVGAVVNDYSGNLFNGAYGAAVTLGQPGCGDGRTSTLFATAGVSYANLYSVALANAFNAANASVCAWAKVPAAIWADATLRCLLDFAVNGSNQFQVSKAIAVNTIRFIGAAGGTSGIIDAPGGMLSWFHVALVKSGTTMIAYVNGVRVGSFAVGVWAGVFAATTCIAGALNTTPASRFVGNAAHVAIFNAALGPAEVKALANA